MSDADRQFVIKTGIDPTGVGPGEARTVEAITAIQEAAAKTAAAMAAMPEGALLSLEQYQANLAATEAATEANARTQGRAVQVANEYGVSTFVAVQALNLLGEASESVALASAEMDAAIESATRSTIEGTAQRAAYAAQVRASTEAMLAEMAALDAEASADEKRAATTDLVTAALQRMGITQAEVTIQAQKLNASYEGTARAMVAIKQAELANEVATIRAEIEGTTVAATETASGLEQVGAQLAQRGEQRHVLTSIREMARGGAYAIRGEAEATFLLGNALDALMPGVGIFIAIASGVALVTQVLEEHSAKVQAEADKAKAKTDEADSSSKVYAKNLKDTFGELEKSAATAFGSIGDMYGVLLAQTQAVTNATKELQRAQDELKSAKLAAQIAQLDSEEEKQEEGKTPDQQAVIKRQFTAQRLNLRQQFVAAIDTLLRRVPAIDWNSPDFIESSEQMRAGLNSPPPGSAEFSEHMLRAILHIQGEAISGIAEERRVSLIQMKEFKEKFQTTIENHNRTQKFATALLDLHGKMIQRLETLGADTSEFQPPDL